MSNADQNLAQAKADELKLLAVLADTLDRVLNNHEQQVKILQDELNDTKKVMAEYER